MKSCHIHFSQIPFRYAVFMLAGFSLIFIQCKDNFLGSDPEPVNGNTLQKSGIAASAPTLPGGALYEISLPDEWKDLVIYAHGYVNAQEELALPDDAVDGQPVSNIINQLGYAYATTSYRANGLVGPEAVDDVVQLVNLFITENGRPDNIYLIGVSEGALVTALTVEQHGDILTGGLAACGPVGDFNKQLSYIGDFHVLFNYFFPGVLAGDPGGVPEDVINDWLSENSTFRQQVADALTNNPGAARSLLKVAKVPVDNYSDPDEIGTTVFDVLRYNVLGTNNSIERLNGLPYDNTRRYYTGTGSFFKDWRLNREIKRFRADASALAVIDDEFQTSGKLSKQLVTTHTDGDQEVPYFHELIYRVKTVRAGSFLMHSNLPVRDRFGHCNFELSELLTSFGLLVFKATLQDLLVPASLFENEQDINTFLNLSRQQGMKPEIRDKAIEPVFN